MHTLLLLKSKNNRENGRLSLFMAACYLGGIMEDNFGAKETAYYSLFLGRLANFPFLSDLASTAPFSSASIL